MDWFGTILQLLAYLIVLGVLLFAIWRSFGKDSRDSRTAREDELRYRGFCPQCGYNLRGGHESCPECGGAGREMRVADRSDFDREKMATQWPRVATPRRAPRDDEQRRVLYETISHADAVLLTQQLECRGIATWIEIGDDAGWPAGDPRRRRKILVWSGDVERADTVMTSFRVDTTESDRGERVE